MLHYGPKNTSSLSWFHGILSSTHQFIQSIYLPKRRTANFLASTILSQICKLGAVMVGGQLPTFSFEVALLEVCHAPNFVPEKKAICNGAIHVLSFFSADWYTTSVKNGVSQAHFEVVRPIRRLRSLTRQSQGTATGRAPSCPGGF